MSAAKYPVRKIAKLKFFAVYALSVLLIVVVLSSFLKVNTAGVERPGAEGRMATDYRRGMDETLHRQMEKLQTACASFVQNSTSKEATDALWQEEEAFSATVDSLRRSSATIPDAGQKQQVESLLDAFNREAKKQISLVKSLAAVPRDTSAATANQSTAELAELKGILVQKEQKIQELTNQLQAGLQEKDNTIASLQNKLNSQPAGTQRTESGGEWKDRYEKLKATTGAQINELKSSYKTVVDDNKRLVTQLQSLRSKN